MSSTTLRTSYEVPLLPSVPYCLCRPYKSVLFICRLAWVLGFAMGPYGCMERTWKPFNPILGETFEVDLDKGVRFFAEQVPPECIPSCCLGGLQR